jgi:hypothetical protein
MTVTLEKPEAPVILGEPEVHGKSLIDIIWDMPVLTREVLQAAPCYSAAELAADALGSLRKNGWIKGAMYDGLGRACLVGTIESMIAGGYPSFMLPECPVPVQVLLRACARVICENYMTCLRGVITVSEMHEPWEDSPAARTICMYFNDYPTTAQADVEAVLEKVAAG